MTTDPNTPPPGVPLTPTRQRLGTGRPGGGQPTALTPQPPPSEASESVAQPAASSDTAAANVPSVDTAAQPPAPPQPAQRPIADSTSRAATAGTAAAPSASAARAEAPAPAAPVAPAAPAAVVEPPAPEPPPAPDDAARLRDAFPDLEFADAQGYLETKLDSGRLLETARRLRDDLGYGYLSSITAVDWLDRVEMVYHLYSFNYLERPRGIVLRVDLDRPSFPDYPTCPSLTALWPGADFQEREVYDLMGVKFLGHPDLRRILLADDFPGHPLRKDFVFDYEYVLVKHLSYGVEGQFAESQAGPRTPEWSPN